MSRSLSDPTGSFPAPNKKENQPVEPLEERDHAWNEGLTNEQYDDYYRTVWNKAYLMLGCLDEADDVANTVMDTVQEYEQAPSKAMIMNVLYKLTTWRALDRLKSPRHQFRVKCSSLFRTQKNDDGEEYEIDDLIDGHPGADEDFFHWAQDQATAQQYAQAVMQLNERQRNCFILNFMDHMKPNEIARKLKIPVGTVSTDIGRARNKIRKQLKAWAQKEKENT